MSLSDAYRTVVLDHNRAPRRRGRLPAPTLSARGVNALCGDTLRLELALADGRIADFAFEARVLLVSRYRFDAESALAPYDLGIGWGRMSDTAIIEQLGLAQSARFLTWRWRDAPPIPADEITRSAANVHVIPANAVVARQVAALRAGQRVRAKGVLVEATRPDGWRWRSSLSRDDGGQGACELMYLAEITVLD